MRAEGPRAPAYYAGRMTASHNTAVALVSVIVIVTSAACGSDNGGGPVGEGDLSAFCDQNEKLDALTRPPSDPELDQLLDSAPAEIFDEVEILVASAKEFRAGNEEAADSDEVQTAGNKLDGFVEESCEDA